MLKKLTFRLALACMGIGFLLVARTATHPHLPKPTDSPRLYATQTRNDLQLTLTGAIKRAEKSIHVAIYALTDRKILRALHDAAMRDCEVIVAYDANNGRPHLSPPIQALPRKLSGLMHRKILVVDEREVWLGTANFTYESLRIHENAIVAINSPELATDLIDAIVGRQTRPPPRTYGDDIELWLLPEDSGALQRLIELIDAAQDRVHVAMFTWTHPELTEAVIRAHHRGVDVRVRLDATTAAGASAQTLQRLVEEGIEVNLPQTPGLVHSKIAIIDQIMVIGSANWTRGAFRSNHDCFLILNGELNRRLECFVGKNGCLATVER